ncbi:MCE family protein [Flammeovirga kamogawensis]|nr:MCE family protein [Flammeovirga kamogawensis]
MQLQATLEEKEFKSNTIIVSNFKIELSNEVKVGLFAIVCGIVLYTGFNFLKGIDIFSDHHTYFIEYDKSPDLQVSNNVTINGVIVGRVSAIELLQNQNNVVRVTIDLKDNILIYTETKAFIADKGMLGDKQIILRTENKTTIAEPNATLQGGIEDGLFASLATKADPLMKSLEQTLDSVQMVLAGFRGTGERVNQMLDKTNSIMSKVDKGGIDQTLYNVKVMTANLKDASAELTPLLAKMDHLADSLNNAPLTQTVKNAQDVLANANRTLNAINDPNGSVGALLTQREMHDQLVSTMASMDSLLIDFKAHPKRYVHFSVFGKKDKAPKEDKK